MTVVPPWDGWNRYATTNCTYANNATFSSNDTYSVWATWVTTTATTTMTLTDNAWQEWNNGWYTISYQVRELTAEERAAAEAERAAARAVAAERQQAITEQRAVAAAQAEAFLLEHLTPGQADEFRQHRHFHVVGRSGHRYRIKCGRAHNVYRLDDNGDETVQYCAHVHDPVPDQDNILAQKLRLEHDEEGFLDIANALVIRR